MPTNKLPEIFKSTGKFSSVYRSHLLKLSKKEITVKDLGMLVFLSAHSTFDNTLYKKTFSKLNSLYKKIAKELEEAPEELKNDDYETVLKIAKIGWKNIERVCFKKLKNLWHIQYNELRTLKPSGTAKQEIKSVYKKFDRKKFNFNVPSVKIERFWKGKLNGMDISLFCNKFPFVQNHTLLVPEQNKNLPQFLKRRFHYHVADLMRSTSGFATGYNSIGAYASVNNLHFQMFVETEPLAVTDKKWKHNGGKQSYPAKCFIFEDNRSSWEFIKILHSENTPYNILYTKEKIYIFPMNFQKKHRKTIFPLGFAWIELSGSFINVSKKDYNNIKESHILREFRMNKFTKKLTLK